MDITAVGRTVFDSNAVGRTVGCLSGAAEHGMNSNAAGFGAFEHCLHYVHGYTVLRNIGKIIRFRLIEIIEIICRTK